MEVSGVKETQAPAPLRGLDELRAHMLSPTALRLLGSPCSPASCNTAFWLQKRALVKGGNTGGNNEFLNFSPISGPCFLDSLSLFMDVILFCCCFGHRGLWGCNNCCEVLKPTRMWDFLVAMGVVPLLVCKDIAYNLCAGHLPPRDVDRCFWVLWIFHSCLFERETTG